MASTPSRTFKLPPILEVLNPREQTPWVFTALLAGMVIASLGMQWLGWPFWAAVAAMLGALLVPGVFKWRADQRRYGATVMGLSFLLAAQGFHSVEHIAQWMQYHVLGWEARWSVGLLSPANSEWVHFVWNTIVVVIVAVLVARGVRNGWAWALLAWALAHTLEHTYLFVRYLLILRELDGLGVTNITAQGLPGFFGQDGWLARSAALCGPFLSRLPGLTTANRIDVHFWWNTGELALLLLAAHTYLRTALPARQPASTLTPQEKP